MLFSLQKICSRVEASERSVEKLLAEVSQLKEEIKRKKQQSCSGKLNAMLVLVRLPKVIQLAEAQNTSELEAAKTVMVAVHKKDCSSSLFFSPPPQEKTTTTQESRRRMFSFVRHCKHFSPILDFRHVLFPSGADR